MAFVIQENSIGWQPIADTDTSASHSVGSIVRAVDPTYGAGEFMYLKGATSTVVGSWVTYNMDDGSTTLLAANAKGPVAVAMSANVASRYGWYQIAGKAVAKAADVANDARVYIDTAAGVCDDAAVAGDLVFNAVWASADDTSGYADVEIARPFVANNGLADFST